MEYETQDYRYELLDDGTLDTVVSATDKEHGHTHEERIDAETAAYYRESDGSFTDQGFADFCDALLD